MGEDPPRYGNAHPSVVPYGVFDAADGPLVITVGNNAQFARFCAVIERPDLAADARYKTNLGRSENRAELLPEIGRELARRSRATLLAALADAGIPCGEVLGLHEALKSERATRAARHAAAAPGRGRRRRAGAAVPVRWRAVAGARCAGACRHGCGARRLARDVGRRGCAAACGSHCVTRFMRCRRGAGGAVDAPAIHKTFLATTRRLPCGDWSRR